MNQGKTVPEGCKEAGIVEQTFYCWRKEYGGLQVDQRKTTRPADLANAGLRDSFWT